MRRSLIALAVFFFFQPWVFSAGPQEAAPPGPLPVSRVYFSPKGGCTLAIFNAIAQAKSSILVQAYSFTSATIADALVNAQRRGVKVEVIIDKKRKRERKGKIKFLVKSGIPVAVDGEHKKAHDKVMIIDGKTVITGSFDFTKEAEAQDAENLLVLDDAVLAAAYTEHWKTHRQHSKPY